jgi:hypothetical protein
MIVDYGRVVKHLGSRSIEAAKNGPVRVGSHSWYGFGELQVKSIGG